MKYYWNDDNDIIREVLHCTAQIATTALRKRGEINERLPERATIENGLLQETTASGLSYVLLQKTNRYYKKLFLAILQDTNNSANG